MGWLARFALVVGGVLVVAGSTAAGVGYYQSATGDCNAGDTVTVAPRGPVAFPDTLADVVAFENLSTEEQRSFLVALESEYDAATLDEDHPEAFEGVDVVAYRGSEYRVTVEELHVICQTLYVSAFKWTGTLGVAAGLALAVPAVIRQHSARVRELVGSVVP